jgi:YbgC/YbaW family acyl-CoA thioester hydrolase
MPAFFRTTRLIEFADTDMAGIVHFSAFFRYMEAAEHALLRILGLSVAMEWEGQTITFPRVAASCEFLKPAHFEDTLDVTARVVRLGNKSVRYAFEFHHKTHLIARGELTAVCCVMRPRGKGMEPVSIPAGIRERLLQEGGMGGGHDEAM